MRYAARPPTTVAQSDPASEILQLVNEVRATYGLSPFRYNSSLAAAAQSHANWMAANTVYSHTGAGGSRPQDRAAAAGYVGFVSENIVGGTDLMPRQGVVWWQNSDIHFNTMISTRYVAAGTGYARGEGQNFYVLVVGRPSDEAPTAPRPSTQNAPDLPREMLFVAPVEISEPREDGAIIHEVKPGQTIWTIAARYEVELAELLWLNNLSDDSFLHPGDEIIVRLPEGASPPPTPTPPLTHIVKEGQTAWTIAARHNIKLDLLLWLNNLDEEAVLQPGDEIIIRLAEGQPPPPTATPIIKHRVEEGQTAWTVAALYDLTLEELLAFNNLSNDAVLHPGDELLVRSPTPPAPPTVPPTFTAVAPTITPSPLPQPEEVALAANVSQNPTPTIDTAPAAAATPLSSPAPPSNLDVPRLVGNIFLGTILVGLLLVILGIAVVISIRRSV